jgi:hypothetical protein
MNAPHTTLRLAILAFFSLSLYIGAQVPVSWDVSLPAPAAKNLDIYRGETVALSPRFMRDGLAYSIATNATAVLYWSTNNFATAPWGTNGTVSTTETGRVTVTWTPSCDAGALQYQYFVGVSDPGGAMYRARGTITMRASPGWTSDGAAPPSWFPATLVPTNILALKTGTTDTDLVLKPDGAGGVAWGTDMGGAGSGTSEATVTNIASIVAGLTNAAHIIASDPHGDRAYADTRTNLLDIATKARDVARTDTNGWEVGSHAGLTTTAQTETARTNAVDPTWRAASNTLTTGAAAGATAVQPAQTNDWVVGSHASFLTAANTQGLVTASITNSCVATNDARYLAALTNAAAFDAAGAAAAATNGINAAFIAAKGGLTNGGPILAPGLNVTLNGGSSPVTLANGSTVTIAASGAGGGGGGISNVIVNGKTGVLGGSGSNIVSTVTLVAADLSAVSNTAAGIAAAGGLTNNHNGGLYVAADGKVGIGTKNPSDTLQVQSAHPSISIWDTSAYNDSPTTILTFAGKVTSAGGYGSLGSISGIKESDVDGDAKSALRFSTVTTVGAATEKVRITSAGDVGIGTTNPTAKLSIDVGVLNPGETRSLQQWHAGYNIGSEVPSLDVMNSETTTNYAAIRFPLSNAGKDVDISFWNLGSSFSEKLRILGSGNVGIGKTNPVCKLHILSTNEPQVKVEYDAANYSTLTHNTLNAQGGTLLLKTAGGTKLTILDSNIGIGTIAPDERLHVIGNAIIASNLTVTGNIIGGNVVTNGGSGSSLTGITAAQVGAVSNTSAGIAAAGGMTNNCFTINNVVVGPGSNVTVSGGAGSGISNILFAGSVNSKTGVVVNFTATVSVVAADIGAVSNTAAGIAAAGGLTNTPTLQQVVTVGGTATNNVTLSGNIRLASDSNANLMAGYGASGDNKTYCIALGYEAGINASGVQNIYLGYDTGLNASGTRNIYAGYASGPGASGDENVYLGWDAGSGAAGNKNIYVGLAAGNSANGNDNYFGGWWSGSASTGNENYYGGWGPGSGSVSSNSTYLGRYAGRNATGKYWLFIDSYSADPGTGYSSTNDNIVINGNTTNLYLGRPTGTVNLRGTVNGSGSSLTGITAAQVGAVPTNRTITIDGTTKALDTNPTFTTAAGAGPTFDQATNIVTGVLSGMRLSVMLTNSFTCTNSGDYTLSGLPSSVCYIDKIEAWLSNTNEGARSFRSSLQLFDSPARLAENMLHSEWTNRLWWAAPLTVASVVGATSNVIADASGVIPGYRYMITDGVNYEAKFCVSNSATTLYWGRANCSGPCSTNKFAWSANGTKISLINAVGQFVYASSDGTSNLYYSVAFNTVGTNTITKITKVRKFGN